MMGYQGSCDNILRRKKLLLEGMYVLLERYLQIRNVKEKSKQNNKFDRKNKMMKNNDGLRQLNYLSQSLLLNVINHFETVFRKKQLVI